MNTGCGAAWGRFFLVCLFIFLACVPHAAAICGNSVVEGTEECDNGNLRGCTTNCLRDPAFYCAGTPSTCTRGFPISLTGTGVFTLSGTAAVDTNALRQAIADASGNSVTAADVIIPPSGSTITPTVDGSGWSVPFQINFANTNAGVVPAVGNNLRALGTILQNARVTAVQFNNICGNQNVELGEGCEFASTFNDGCTTSCQNAAGYSCRANLVSTTTGGVTTQHVVCTLCGNAVLNTAGSSQTASEVCDDGNVNPGDGCGRECLIESGYQCSLDAVGKSVCVVSTSVCGNGLVQTGEGCDDGNLANGDGCSAGCAVESGFSCTTNSAGRSVCVVISANCGNGLVQSTEGCDDGNLINGDGCSSGCLVEAGYTCVTNGAGLSVCTLTVGCGNGVIQATEGCDDGNLVAGDGCSATCTVEAGFICVPNAQNRSVCALNTATCGNSLTQTGEECDDGNVVSGDGCSSICKIESGWNCTTISGGKSICVPANCGNSVVNTGEGCDDGNLVAGDGCSSVCTVESGYSCTKPITGVSVCTFVGAFDDPFDGDDDDSDELWWVILLCILVGLCLLALCLWFFCRKRRPKAPPPVYVQEPMPAVVYDAPKPAPFYVHPPPQIQPQVVYEMYDSY